MVIEKSGLNLVKSAIRETVTGSPASKPCKINGALTRKTELVSENETPKTSVFKTVKNSVTALTDKLKIKMLKLGMKFTLGAGSPVLTEYISKNFNQIKSQLLKTNLDESILAKIEECKSPEEITNIVKNLKMEETSNLLDFSNKTLSSNISRAKKQQLIQSANKEYGAKMVDLEKALSVPSADPKVAEIESTLKNKYGFEFVSLKDDYEHAQKVLKACEIMTKNGQPLPKNYIVSNMMVAAGQSLKAESTVILTSSKLDKIINPKNVDTKNLFSTTDELQYIIHEFGHNLQPDEILTYELPKQFKKVPKTISKYANSGSNAELWAELFAKNQLAPKTVTKEQRELFEHLKGLSSEEYILNNFA